MDIQKTKKKYTSICPAKLKNPHNHLDYKGLTFIIALV